MRRIMIVTGLLLSLGGLTGCGHSTASSQTSSPPASTPSAPPQSSHTAVPAGCQNVDVTDAVKAALVQSDGRANATEVAGATFYGTCGTTQYAVTRMMLGPGGTDLQSVAFQDGGAFPELLVDTGTSWRLIIRSATPTGCTTSTVLPAALRTAWQDCAVATPTAAATPSATATTCQQFYAGKVFVLAKKATVNTDGSAVLTGAPVTVHCGGPDDFQFVPQAGTLTVDLAVGATITVIAEPSTTTEPLPVSKLPAYVSSGKAESDVFLLTGTQSGAVFDATAIAEQFHP